jgi:WD40 repeat protein
MQIMDATPIANSSGTVRAGRTVAIMPTRNFASRVFGYDVFISFALGPPPRGSHSYASDLARRLRERDFTVFFSEDEAPPGAELNSTLRNALFQSKALVVIANRGTLKEPRWVRTEVEEYGRRHPDRPIIPISVDGALQDPALASSTQQWLGYQHRIWLDESAEAVAGGIATPAVVERLALAPTRARSNVAWRWVVRVTVVVLAILSMALAWATYSAIQSAERARAELRRALSLKLISESQSMLAGSRGEGDERAMLQVLAAHQLAPGAGVDAALLDTLLNRMALRKLMTSSGPVAAVRFSTDGQQLLSAERDHHASGGSLGVGNFVRRWDIASGQPIGALVAVAPSFQAVDFSADGTRLATTSGDDAVRIFDTSSGALRLGPLHGANWLAETVAFSRDQKRIVAGYQDGTLQVWDGGTGNRVGPAIEAQADSIGVIAFSSDGRQFATGGGRPALRLWDAVSFRPIAVDFGEALNLPGATVQAIAFATDGVALVVGGRDLGTTKGGRQNTSLRMWRLGSAVPAAAALVEVTAPVTAVAYSLDGTTIAFGGYDGPLWIWSTSATDSATTSQPGPGAATALTGHRGSINSLTFSPDSKLLASGGDDADIRVWDATPRRSLASELPGSAFGLTSVAFSPDGKRVAVGNDSTEGGVTIWDAVSGRKLAESVDRHRNMVTAVAFVPADGRRIVSASTDGTLRVWDAETGRAVGTSLEGDAGAVTHIAISRDGTRIASSGHAFVNRQKTRRVVRLWDVSSGRLITTRWNGDDAGFTVFAFSEDGHRLLTGEADGGLALRDTDTGEVVGPKFEGLSFGANRALFSPDGTRVAAAAGEGVRLWDARTGLAIGQMRIEHTGAVTGLAFSPDGSRLVSGSRDGTLRVWSGFNGEPIGAALVGHTREINDVAYSADGQRLASASADGSLRLWPAPQAWPDLLCSKLQRNMTADEWHAWVSPELQYEVQCQRLPVPNSFDAVPAGASGTKKMTDPKVTR